MSFSYPSGSRELIFAIIAGLVVSSGLCISLFFVPARARRPIVGTLTFLAGAFYVLLYLWPTGKGMKPGDLPLNNVEAMSAWLKDAQPIVSKLANGMGGLLFGLGIYSLLRVHLGRLVKKHKDWFFSLVFILSMIFMCYVSYANWYAVNFAEGHEKLVDRANWTPIQYTFDVLFDGMLQQMDSAMFSIIAFFILSAAYRAFRVRSIESTILLATALLMMLSLMGAVEYFWNNGVTLVSGGQADSIWNNLQLKNITDWLRSNVQNPGIRAVDFGIGVGALAMGLRLWLSLEKGGVGV